MFFSSALRRGAMLVLMTLAASGVTVAATHADARTLTLQQAVDKALASNPAIQAADIDVDIQRAQRDASALGTQYRVLAGVQDVFGGGQFSGFDSAETTVQLTKTVEFGDKRQRRAELGDAQVAQAELAVSQQQLAVAGEVARRYAEVLRSQQRRALAAETLAVNERTLEIVSRRFEVGRASEADRASANVSLARIRLTAERLDYGLSGAKARLAVMWGESEAEFDAVSGDLFRVPPVAGFEQLAVRLGNNVSLRQLERQARVNQASRRLAESARSPNLLLSGGVRHFAFQDEAALLFSLALPLGNASRAEPLLRQADGRSARLPYTRRTRELELRAQLYERYTALQASQRQLEGLQAEVLSEAEKAVTFYERGYEIGSNSLLELLAAQQQLLQVRSEALDAAAACHLALIDIETLLGNKNPGEALQ